MTNREFYRRTFSQLHSSAELNWEAFACMTRRKARRGTIRRAAVIAAGVAVLAALSTAAVATGLFGLGRFLMGEQARFEVPDGNGGMVQEQSYAITLQGYSDTPESRAKAEWESWLAGYDPDKAILERIGNRPVGPFSPYDRYYNIYTQEMADELAEIAERHGLNLHTGMTLLEDPQELFQETGGDFLGPNTAYTAYLYEDGTFAFDGEMDRRGGDVSIQFMRCVKGTLTDVMLVVGEPSLFESWEYRSACGIPVTLALGPYKGLLLAELADCYISVNILMGTEGEDGLTPADLEAFADSLDLTLLTPVKAPEIPDSAEEEPFSWPAPEEDAIYLQTGIQEAAAQRFFSQFALAVETRDVSALADMLCLPMELETGDGERTTIAAEEDLYRCFDTIFSQQIVDAIQQNRYTRERADLYAHGGMVGLGTAGEIWFGLAEDGDIRVFTIQQGDGGMALRRSAQGISDGPWAGE